MVVTICGSFKFKKEMWECYKKLTSLGYLVFLPAIDCDKMAMERKRSLHFKKISQSNLIFVVDVNGYIGEDTKKEVDFANAARKGIIYYSSGILDVLDSSRENFTL